MHRLIGKKGFAGIAILLSLVLFIQGSVFGAATPGELKSKSDGGVVIEQPTAGADVEPIDESIVKPADESLVKPIDELVIEPIRDPVPQSVAAKAAELDKEIVEEAVEMRTGNSRHYKLSDGSYLADISATDQNYQDERGAWRTIDTTLIDEADIDYGKASLSKESSRSLRSAADAREQASAARGLDAAAQRETTSYRAPYVPFDAEIPKRIGTGYAIGKGGEQLRFIPQGAADAEALVEGNAAVYPQTWVSTDLKLEVLDSGIKETLILHNEQAPTSFRFEVEGDLAGAKNLILLPAWLKDAAGTIRDVEQTVLTENGKQYIELNADVQGLVYPIEVDPTITIAQPVQDAYSSGVSGNQYTNYGTSAVLSLNVNSWYQTENPLIKWDLSSIPTTANVSNAVASLNFYSPTVYAGSVRTHQITASWAENTVHSSNLPSINTTGIKTTQTPVGTTSFNPITLQLVQGWVTSA